MGSCAARWTTPRRRLFSWVPLLLLIIIIIIVISAGRFIPGYSSKGGAVGGGAVDEGSII